VTIASRSCGPVPDLGTATPVPLDASKPVEVPLDEKAKCLGPAGGPKAVYAVFALPSAAEPYVLGITSVPAGQGLFSPRVALLDAQGSKRRDIGRDNFTFHGSCLYVGLRVHADERYLLVTSDPETVGKQVQQISEQTRATLITAGVLSMQYHSGSDTTSTLTYALNGTITVTAQPLPKAN
jgi:hypothetical protein